MIVTESFGSGDTKLVLHESAVVKEGKVEEELDLNDFPSSMVEQCKRIVSKWSREDQEHFKANPRQEVLVRLMKKYKNR